MVCGAVSGSGGGRSAAVRFEVTNPATNRTMFSVNDTSGRVKMTNGIGGGTTFFDFDSAAGQSAIAVPGGNSFNLVNGATSVFHNPANSVNIGLGTTSPYARLAVVGEVVARNFTATSTTATSTFAGTVGIGTQTPNFMLDVLGTTGIGVTSNSASTVFTGNASNNATVGLELQSLSARRFRILSNSTLTTFEATNTNGFSFNSNVGVGTTTRFAQLFGLNIATSTVVNEGQFVNVMASTTAATTQTVNWNTGTVQSFNLTANTKIVINATSSSPIIEQ